MTAKIYEFETSLCATEAEALAFAMPPLPAISVGAPKDFGGEGDRWTPEHLLLASVSSCFWTTLRALARRRGLRIAELVCHAHATVAKDPGGLDLTGIRLAVDVEVGSGDLERARAVVDEAERLCLVSRSLRIPVRLEAVVTSTPHLDAEVNADV